MSRFEITSGGWLPDTPDARDFSPKTEQVVRLLAPLGDSDDSNRDKRIDLREFFAEVDEQQHVNCSCSHACTALLEYFRTMSGENSTRLSRLFLYKTTRRLMGVSGNVGTNLRSTLRTIRLFGMPPERYLPFEAANLDDEPDAFLYSFKEPYNSLSYVRLDSKKNRGKSTLKAVKAFLSAGIPVVFGFSVPSSISRSSDIPYRPKFDGVCCGQAAVAVGFDDDRVSESKGALLIRNSWGQSWGEDGYGWLPYAYVTTFLAVDFWTILHRDWLASGDFKKTDVVARRGAPTFPVNRLASVLAQRFRLETTLPQKSTMEEQSRPQCVHCEAWQLNHDYVFVKLRFGNDEGLGVKPSEQSTWAIWFVGLNTRKEASDARGVREHYTL